MPAGNLLYVVRGSGTTGASANKDYCGVAPGSTSARIAITGCTLGNQSQTSALAVAWQFGVFQTAPSGVSNVKAQALDTGNTRASTSTAYTALTGQASGQNAILDEFAFDAVGSYTKWYPPGKELWVDGAFTISSFAVSTFIVRKVVGSESSSWSISVYFAE